jgi:hypothetical protein
LNNVSLVLRKPGADLVPKVERPLLKIDEAFKGFIMLAAALIYSVVLLGPWGILKQAAYNVGSLPWMFYAVGLIIVALVVIPVIYLLASSLGNIIESNHSFSLRARFLRSTAGLVPLGLAAWIAFSISFVLVNGSYILATLSDPLGWGWNLFGTAQFDWTPVLTAWVPALQMLVLLGGLTWATKITVRSLMIKDNGALKNVLAVLPTGMVYTAITALFLWIYL